MSHAPTLPLSVKPSLADRALSLVTRIQPEERGTTLLLALNMFVLLASYYMLKTVREALVLSEFGAELKSYSAAIQAALLLGVIPLYGLIASRIRRGLLVAGTTLFFISNLVLFYVAGKAGAQLGIIFFLWLGIFNVMVTSQFWAFANDIYDQEQGRRLMPFVGIGSSLGAWVGSTVVSRMFKTYDSYQVMLFAAAGLAFCVVANIVIDRRETEAQKRNRSKGVDEPLGKEGGFRLIFKNRYLLLIALLILFLNIVNTTGEYILGKIVTSNAGAEVAAAGVAEKDVEDAKEKIIGQFYGGFYGNVNLLGFLLQLFLVSRLFKVIGVRGALFILPVLAMGAYSLIAIMPVLAIIRVSKVMENATDYSIQNTARHALFLPTTREAKYKAKAAIDTFFWRAGDALQAVIVYGGTTIFALGISGFATVNVVLAVVWLLLAVGIFYEHRKLSAVGGQ